MRFVLLVLLGLGCSTKANPASCLDGHCSDPELPFCDTDGTIGGEPNMCIAVGCTPDTFEACRGDRALTCNAAGDNYELVDCPFGCGDTGCNPCNTPECEKHIIPKYLPNICDELSSGDVTFDTQTLDTSNELNCTEVVAQSQGPEICVYRRSTITIGANQTLRVTGTRAIALVADRDLKVVGSLDISAKYESAPFTHGPGGGTTTSGGAGDAATGTGGGGAGFKTSGGHGGSRSALATNGGAVAINPNQLTYLTGGTAPPRTGSSRDRGHAGGAATLISCRGTVSVEGVIDAGGGGGQGGHTMGAVHVPAQGGASGGNVVIQGMNVEITGQLFANGGGGGAGEDNLNLADAVGASGGKGGRSLAGGSGGLGQPGSHGSSGGRGGSVTHMFGENATQASSTGYGGAGGGSAGFLQTYTPAGVPPTLMPVAVSPPLEGNMTIPTN